MASRRHLLQLGTIAGAGPGRPRPCSPLPPRPPARPLWPGRLRPPAVPLAVAVAVPEHLARRRQPARHLAHLLAGRITAMTGIATIDGSPFLFLGSPASPTAYPFPTLRQLSLTVTATKSEFVLAQGGVEADRDVPVPGGRRATSSASRNR